MKVEILQEDLVQKLAICTRFASSKVQLPVLANVLLKASSNKLTLAATNLELSISFVLGAKVIEEGSITVPAKNFYDIVTNLSKGQVTLFSEKEQLSITQESFEGLLSGMNSTDFPEVISDIKEKTASFDTQEIKDKFEEVLFSVSSDDARPVLNGVLFIFDKDTVSLVSTDGFRLTKVNLKFDNLDFSQRVIIPKNTISEVIKIFQSGEVDFHIDPTDKQIVFSDGSCVLSSRIIDGEFPNFEKILPKDSNISVDISKDEFSQGIKLASVFARDSSNVVTCLVTKQELTIKAENSTTGKQKKAVAASVTGDFESNFSIAFNYHFLEELVRVVKGESLILKITNPSAAVMFLDSKNADFMHVIMPIKLTQ